MQDGLCSGRYHRGLGRKKGKKMSYQVQEVSNGKPIKLWTEGVPVEDEARQQLVNTASMPFIFRHLAVMPDVHLGKGSTIGSVIPTLGGDHPGGGRGRYRLRHDGGADQPGRERPAGSPVRPALGH